MHSLMYSIYFGSPLAVVPVVAPLLPLVPIILGALGTVLLTLFKPSTVKKLLQLLWVQKIVLAGLLVLFAGAVITWPVIFSPHMETLSDSGPGRGEWPLWRGSPSRAGVVRGNEDPVRGGVLWSFIQDDIKTIYSSPAAAGNRVYVTSARWELFRKDGAICSVSADSGKLVWMFNEDGYRPTFSSPAVSGKYLVVGEGLHLTTDSRVFCFDVEASEQARRGVKLWEFRTRSHVESSPAIADGRTFVGAGDDGFYCFALEPKADGSANVLWHLPGKDYPDCETSPLVHDGKVYFGLGNNGQAVVCVDAATGREIWRTPTPYPAFGGPSFADGRIYFGMGNGDFVNSARTLGLPAAGELWCLDAGTGQPIWKQTLPDTVLEPPALDDDRLYVSCRDGFLYCFDTEGGAAGKWNAYSPLVTTPAVTDRHVYVMTGAGTLYALDRKMLNPVWQVGLNSPESFSSPTVAHGHVYLGTTTAGLVCVGEPGQEPPAPVWVGFRGGPGATGSIDGSLVPSRGEFAWSFDGLDENTQDSSWLFHSPPAALGGNVYVGASRGLLRLDAGNSLSDKPARGWLAPSANPVSLSPALTPRTVFFVDGKRGDSRRALHAVQSEKGCELWQVPVSPEASGQFVLTPTHLFINDARQRLTCLDVSNPESCVLLWTVPTPTPVGPPAVVGRDILVLAAADPPQLLALDLLTGTILWSEDLPGIPRTPAAVIGERVWIGLDSGVNGYSLLLGESPRTVDCGPVRGVLVNDERHIVADSVTGELIVIDPVTAKETRRITGLVGDFPPVLAGGVLLYQSAGALTRLDLNSGESTYWTRIRPGSTGNPVSPAILVDSHVLFLTDTRGLVAMKPGEQ